MYLFKEYRNNYAGAVHVFDKNRDPCYEADADATLNTTETNWDSLETIPHTSTDKAEIISYNQALEYFKETDLSEYNENVTSAKKSGIFSCFSNRGKSKLKQDHISDFNLIFIIAKCPYQKENKIHIAMLRTVYNSLVSSRDSKFIWENIGFQSDLPWTDLRGVGMLGVLQLLYMCTTYPIIRDTLYELSRTKSNTFPFAVLSLNVTSIVLNVLRREKLNREINKEGVFVCINKLYTSMFHYFGQVWIDERKTISDVGSLLKDVEQLCLFKRGRKKIFKNFKVSLERK